MSLVPAEFVCITGLADAQCFVGWEELVPAGLDVAELACRRGGRPVFDRLSFALGAGELLALTGRNGSGKTTLFGVIAGDVAPEHGSAQLPPRWRLDLDRLAGLPSAAP